MNIIDSKNLNLIMNHLTPANGCKPKLKLPPNYKIMNRYLSNSNRRKCWDVLLT